ARLAHRDPPVFDKQARRREAGPDARADRPRDRAGHRLAARNRYDRRVSHWDAVVDEVANELATWPGVHISRREDGAAVVRYEHSELGLLYPDRGVAELPFLESEADELIE